MGARMFIHILSETVERSDSLFFSSVTGNWAVTLQRCRYEYRLFQAVNSFWTAFRHLPEFPDYINDLAFRQSAFAGNPVPTGARKAGKMPE